MFCKNCGRNIGNTTRCPICDGGGVKPILSVKPVRSTSSTVFMVLYAVFVAICAIWQYWLSSNFQAEISAHTNMELSGRGLFVVFIILAAIPIYFMAKRNKLRLCAIFFLIGMLFLTIGSASACFSIFKAGIYYEYGYEVELFSSVFDEMSGEYEEIQTGLSYIKIILIAVCFFAILVPSAMFSSTMLLMPDKKWFTILMIIATIIAAFISVITCGIGTMFAGPYPCLILFLGFYMRTNYSALLSEKKIGK